MKKECFWKDARYRASEPLAGNETTQYLIVGGGIGGLMTAHFLLERGATDIVLIERDTIGSGSTGHSAGMLVAEIETASWRKLAAVYGIEWTRVYWQAQEASLSTVRDLVASAKIKCDFDEEQFLFLAHALDKESHEEERSIREKIGADNTILTKSEAQDELGVSYFPTIERLEVAASVHPLKLAHGIAKYLRERGVRIYEHTSLTSVTDSTAAAEGGEIAFEKIIYALGTLESAAEVHNLVTTACVTRKLTGEELDRAHLAHKDMFLDMEKRSYHYGKITHDGRVLIGYGDVEDHGHHMPDLHEPHVHNIERFLSKVFGLEKSIAYAWSGRYSLSKHPLPYFAHDEKSIRFGGAGTQLATIALASLAAAHATASSHVLAELFEPEVA